MENKKQQLISRDKLLESGIHFGHQTRRWNPAMKSFIHGANKGVHIINLNKTISSLDLAYNAVSRIAAKGGNFLFVGTQRQSKETVRENAIRTGSFYINHRWLGGTLTNQRTIQNSVNRLRHLERLAKDNFAGYTKKEGVEMQRELDKLERALGGIKFMRRLPSAIIVASITEETIAIKEARKLGIPVFGIADSNSDPRSVNYPIVGNDDSSKAVALVTTILADAIAKAKGEAEIAANKSSDDQVKVLGVVERAPRAPRPQRGPRREFDNNRNEAPKAAPKTEKVEISTADEPASVKKEVEAPVKEANTQDFSKLKVAELKDLLNENNIEFKSTMKKADLVELATANIK